MLDQALSTSNDFDAWPHHVEMPAESTLRRRQFSDATIWPADRQMWQTTVVTGSRD